VSIKQVIALLFIVILGITTVTLLAENNSTGTGALGNISTGQDNSAFGVNAGAANTTGLNNLFLGAYAGNVHTTGRGNIYLGAYSQFYVSAGATLNDRLYVGNNRGTLIYGNIASDSLLINGALRATGTLRGLQDVEIVTESDTLTADQSGLLSIYRPLAAKADTELPTAAKGLVFEFMIADTDSLLIKAASGDSLITSAGAAYKTQSSVAGTVKLIAIDATRWVMQYTLGTWTGY